MPLAKCSSILAVPLLLPLLGRCEFHRGKHVRSTRKVHIGTLNEFNLSAQLKCVIKICILICQARKGREEYGGCGVTGLQSYANISIKYSRNMKIVRVNSARRRCSKSGNYTRKGERGVGGVEERRSKGRRCWEINFIIKKRKETHLIKQFPFCQPTVMFC